MGRDVRVVLVDEEVIVGVSTLAHDEVTLSALAAAAGMRQEERDGLLPHEELWDAIRSVQREQRGNGGGPGEAYAVVVTVLSLKDGRGKTRLVTDLAVALSLITRQKVAVIDLDTVRGGVADLLGLRPERGARELAAEIDRADDEALLRLFLRHESGVMVLAAGGSQASGLVITGEQVRKLVQRLAARFDYVLIDGPLAIDDTMLTAAEISTLILVLTDIEKGEAVEGGGM